MSGTALVPMISPDGRHGDIPASQVASAKAAGFKVGVDMLSPDGQSGVIPAENYGQAVAAGFKVNPQSQNTSPQVQDPGFFHGVDESFGGVWDSIKQRAAEEDSLSWKDRLKEGATGAVMNNPGLGLLPRLVAKVASDAYDQGKQAVTHGVKAVQAGLKGDTNTANLEMSEVQPHILAAQIPFLGPVAAKAGEDIGQGRTGEGTGEAVGAVGQVVAPELMQRAPGVVGNAMANTGRFVENNAPVIGKLATGVGVIKATAAGHPLEAVITAPYASKVATKIASGTGSAIRGGGEFLTSRFNPEPFNPGAPFPEAPPQSGPPSSPYGAGLPNIRSAPFGARVMDVTPGPSASTPAPPPTFAPEPGPAPASATPAAQPPIRPQTPDGMQTPWGGNTGATGTAPNTPKMPWESDADYARRNLYENAKAGGREARANQVADTSKTAQSVEFQAQQAAQKAYQDTIDAANTKDAWQSLKSRPGVKPPAGAPAPLGTPPEEIAATLQKSIDQVNAAKQAARDALTKQTLQATTQELSSPASSVSYDVAVNPGEGSEGTSVIIRPKVSGNRIPSGNLMANIKGDTARVLNVSLPESAQGLHIGSGMYKTLIDHILAEHPEVTKLEPGTSTTDQAGNVWKSLRDRYESSGSKNGIDLTKPKK